MSYYSRPGIPSEFIVPDMKQIIIESVVRATDVSMEDIQSKLRLREVVEARHLICYFLRNHTMMPLQKIGNLINRDHSTVIHGYKTVKNLIETDADFRALTNLVNHYISTHGYTIQKTNGATL
jgi:chromosomal replication initiator protein